MRAYFEHGGFYAVARVAKGKGGRLKLHILHVADLTEAQALADRIAVLLEGLAEAGQPSDVRRDAASRMAEADHETRAAIERFVRTKLMSREYVRPVREVLTVRQFGERWTGGQLAQQYRGKVRPLQRPKQTSGLLEKWVYRVIGDLPLGAVRIEDVELVADGIATPRLSSKKAVLGKLRRLFAIAVYPARQIKENPLPKELLAIEDDRRAFGWLRTGEVARLLACTAIPLGRRLCWGVMVHEGLRPEDAADLRWSQIDLDLGVITLHTHKTQRAMGSRAWALQPDVHRALLRQRQEEPAERAPWQVALEGMAEQLRADLLTAGVDRPELHQTTETQRQLRAHDLRATFVTLALADGRSEAWVMDRTGHLTPRMLQVYKRQARTAADLRLGWLGPLDEAFSEWREGVGANSPSEGSCSQEGRSGDQETAASIHFMNIEKPMPLGDGQKGRDFQGSQAGSTACEQAANRPRRPLRRTSVSALRAASSQLLTARLARVVEARA